MTILPSTAALGRGAAALLLLAGTQLVHAQAKPITQIPSPDSTIAAAPNEIEMGFNKELKPHGSSLTLKDAQGKSLTNGKSRLSPTDAKTMTVGAQKFGPGTYSVDWIATAVDGKRTKGNYVFTVK
ncbi:MAG: copper resistance CopC family protein [Janthinobacterium lividum]